MENNSSALTLIKKAIKRSFLPSLVVIGLVSQTNALATESNTPIESQAEILSKTIKAFEQKCQTKAWRIWEASLCGKLLFVNPSTREIYGSAADSESILMEKDDLWVGKLPDNETIANTDKTWAGSRWSMIMLPLPKLMEERLALIAHESFHRIQPQLGFEKHASDNGQLSDLEGRYWFLLELRALASALEAVSSEAYQAQLSDHTGESAALDALRFRAQRYQNYPHAKENEQKLEFNEGLAEYTGQFVNENPNVIKNLVERLGNADQQETLERSFAYLTGAAYGLLLDHFFDKAATNAPSEDTSNTSWVGQIDKSFSFSDALQKALRINRLESNEKHLKQLGQKYQAEALWISEKAKFEAAQARNQKYIAQFVKGKTLRLPIDAIQMSFNPNHVVSLEPYGKVYQTITVIDRWGKIESEGGLLIAKDFSHIKVNAGSLPSNFQKSGDKVFESDGWRLTINDGWQINAASTGFELIQSGG